MGFTWFTDWSSSEGRVDLRQIHLIAIEALRRSLACDSTDARVKEFDSELKDTKLSWSRIYRLEKMIAPLLTGSILRSETDARILDAESLRLDGAATLRKTFDELAKDNDVAMRAHYLRVLRELHWHLANTRLNKDVQSKAAVRLLVFAIAIAALIVAGSYFFPFYGSEGNLTPKSIDEVNSALRQNIYVGLLTASIFGVIGAFFSRLSSFQTKYSTLSSDDISSVFRPRILALRLAYGMFGSIILYFAIRGGLLGGSLFPNLDQLVFSSSQPRTNAMATYQSTGLGEYAKLAVWSVIGGFSERLVPDTLEKLENQATKQPSGNNKSGPGQPAPH